MTSTPSTSTTIPAGFSRRIKQSLKLRLQDEVDRDLTSTSGATTSAPIDVAACAQALSDILGYERKSRTGGTGVFSSSGVSPGAPTKTTAIDAANLRSVVERRGLALNESFLDASLRAQSKMTQVEATLRALDDARERMRFALDASNSKTAELLRESERAKENLKLIESRRDLVKSFAADFQLPKTFVEALSVRPTEDSTNDEELPKHFFEALERVKAIQANCAKLVNTDQQRAGLELMDVMTTYAESAHEKLRRWVIAKCRILAEDDDFITEHDEKTLQKAVETLRQRPLLFKACVEEVTRTRHNALFRRFITALTRGGAGTKPIEVHAHDPLRYVGDMLSWVHQAVASEKEFCMMTFGSDEDGGIVEIDGVAFDATQDVLEKVFDACCRPLKVRVEQVFVTSSGAMEGGVMVAYKLANLMSFYKKLMFDLLGDEATLTKTMAGLKESAKTSFSDAVSQHSGKFKKTSLAPSAFAGGEDAFAPPSTLREGVSSAMDLLEAVASSSASSSGGSEEESKELLSAALDGLIDPIVQAVETAAVKVGDQMQSVIGSAASGPKWVGDAFALNCLNAIREPLRSHSSAGGKVEEISRLIARKVSDVADSEAGGLLAASGLSDALELVVLYQEQGLSSGSNVMANDPALKIDRLAAALSSLVDAAGTKLPDFAQVQSPAIRRDVTNRYNSKLIEAYSRVYAAVLQPASGYPSDVRSRIRHGPDALSTVLGGA